MAVRFGLAFEISRCYFHHEMKSLSDILHVVTNRMKDAGVDCLLIGGFAVNYHGYTRNTLDIERDIKPLCDRHGTAKAFDLIRSQVEALKTP
jgi:hypothetical protein